VSHDLRLMSAALFRPEPMGLILSHKPSRIARFLQQRDQPQHTGRT
jgi:hypothetical protein